MTEANNLPLVNKYAISHIVDYFSSQNHKSLTYLINTDPIDI